MVASLRQVRDKASRVTGDGAEQRLWWKLCVLSAGSTHWSCRKRTVVLQAEQVLRNQGVAGWLSFCESDQEHRL